MKRPWAREVAVILFATSPAATLRLAVRNAAKPSRILRCIYKVPSVSAPERELTVEVETNVSERLPKYPLQQLPFANEPPRYLPRNECGCNRRMD
jgi:hypothetical protein